MTIAYGQLSPTELRERARGMGEVAHAGHRNKHNGEPYFDHPIRVADHVRRLSEGLGLTSEAVASAEAAAYLHDTVEDTPVTIAMLAELGFPSEMIRLVGLLTREAGAAKDDLDYYHRIAADPVAKLVKLADLADNTDPDRMSLVESAKREALRAKYEKAYRALGEPVPVHLLKQERH